MLQNLLQERIEKDTGLTIARGLPDKKKWMPLLDSWTSFQKETEECPVCKTYFDFLVGTMEVL